VAESSEPGRREHDASGLLRLAPHGDDLDVLGQHADPAAEVAAVRALARERRASDLADNKLLTALCPGLIDTGRAQGNRLTEAGGTTDPKRHRRLG